MKNAWVQKCVPALIFANHHDRDPDPIMAHITCTYVRMFMPPSIIIYMNIWIERML